MKMDELQRLEAWCITEKYAIKNRIKEYEKKTKMLHCGKYEHELYMYNSFLQFQEKFKNPDIKNEFSWLAVNEKKWLDRHGDWKGGEPFESKRSDGIQKA